MQQQFALRQRTSQVGFDAHARQHALVHVMAVKGDAAGVVVAVLLGAEHRDVGQAQQGFGLGAILRIDADADAGAGAQLIAFDQKWRQQRRQQLLRDHARFQLVANVGQRDREFIAAHARHQILFAQGAAKALRYLAQ